jgi:hypothetical protein
MVIGEGTQKMAVRKENIRIEKGVLVEIFYSHLAWAIFIKRK